MEGLKKYLKQAVVGSSIRFQLLPTSCQSDANQRNETSKRTADGEPD